MEKQYSPSVEENVNAIYEGQKISKNAVNPYIIRVCEVFQDCKIMVKIVKNKEVKK